VRARLFLVLSLLSTRLPIGAPHAWTPSQTALAALTSAEILVDWGQTRDALNLGHAELNPVLGRHPSAARLAVYNAIAIPGTLGIGALVSSQWRTVWFASVAVMETAVVTRNAILGFQVHF
jgi:hypothetical protein